MAQPAAQSPTRRGVNLSPGLARQLDAAEQALDAGHHAEARAQLERVLDIWPDATDARRLLGVTWQQSGDAGRACAELQRVLAADPGDAHAWLALGLAQADLQAWTEAEASFDQASRLAPELAQAWYHRARSLLAQDRPGGAVTALYRALDHAPDAIPARLLLAEAEARLGAGAQAAASLREVLAREPDCVAAWFALARLPGVRFDAADLDRVRGVLHGPRLRPDTRLPLGFVQAWIHEDLDDWHEAYRDLRKANAAMRRHRVWQAPAFHARVEAMRQAFARRPASAAAPAASGVVFVTGLAGVGLERVGDLLAAHPEAERGREDDLRTILIAESQRRQQPLVAWATEASAADWERLGAAYLARGGSGRAKPWRIDVSAANWLFLGAALAMLPGARVIDVRRTALETCLGAWRGWFEDSHLFSYSLDDTAACWHDYLRLMRHWRARHAGRVLEFPAGALDRGGEEPVRRLLNWIGMPVAPECLRALATRQRRDDYAALVAGYAPELGHLRTLLGLR